MPFDAQGRSDTLAVSMISTFSGFVAWMDGHQWLAVIVAGLGAAMISTTGNFLYKMRQDRWRLRAKAAEEEMKKMRGMLETQEAPIARSADSALK
jgi:hypothetical protein